jgi:peptidoglycan/xylan/chitin deacetylase (PgdA/CDA1 family)
LIRFALLASAATDPAPDLKKCMPAFRLDQLLTLYLFRPFCGEISKKNKLGLPILMYHSISDESEENISPYYRTATSPKVFAVHMALLRSQGYEVLGLQAGLEKFRCENPAGTKLAVITFDDGFRDFYTAALPVLRQNNFGATVFLPTAFIGRERLDFKGRVCMTWDEIRESQKAGIEFGSHTANHPKLYDLDVPQIHAELKESKAAIENEIGKPVRSFAYPYAFPSTDRAFVKVLVELLKETGYDSGVTTKIGLAAKNDDPFALKRLPMNSTDDEALFLAKLVGAYDWLAWPQEVFKAMKNFISPRRINPVTAKNL